MAMGILDAGKCWLVNDRYEIWKDCGVIYDTEQAQDIPQSIFGIRDRLMQFNRSIKVSRQVSDLQGKKRNLT